MLEQNWRNTKLDPMLSEMWRSLNETRKNTRATLTGTNRLDIVTFAEGLKLSAQQRNVLLQLSYSNKIEELKLELTEIMKQKGCSEKFIQHTLHHLTHSAQTQSSSSDISNTLNANISESHKEKLFMIEQLLLKTGASTKFRLSTMQHCIKNPNNIESVLANLQRQTLMTVAEASNRAQ